MSTSDEVIEAFLAVVRERAEKYARAKSDHVHLEHGRKALLANLMLEAADAGEKTAAAQERTALASERYAEYLEVLRDAHEQMILLEWQLKEAEWKVELFRTQEATRRIEARHYGMG